MILNKKAILIIKFILFFCWAGPCHVAFNRYVYEHCLNEETRILFNENDAKEIFLQAKNSTYGWNNPDYPDNRTKDTKKFGGGHSWELPCEDAAVYYIGKSIDEYTKGGKKNIQKAAYYLAYALHFVQDISSPVHRNRECDSRLNLTGKIKKRCHHLHENINKPGNGTDHDNLNNKTGEVISFGSPKAYSLEEMGLTLNVFKNGNLFNDIVALISTAEDIKETGSKIIRDKENTDYIRTECGIWQKLLLKSHTLAEEKQLYMKQMAYTMKYLKTYCEGSIGHDFYFKERPSFSKPIGSFQSPSEQTILPVPESVEKITPPLKTAPSVNFGNNIIILDNENTILSWLNNNKINLDERNILNGFKTADLLIGMKNITKDDILFKQGNKLFINGDSDNERCLYRFRTKITRDYKDQFIKIECDEVFSDLENVDPFYIFDQKWENYRYGNNIIISKEFLTKLLEEYYIIDDTTAIDLFDLEPAQLYLQIDATITILDLLREVEKKTGAIFKRHYTIVEKNSKHVIESKIELLKPKRFGHIHDAPKEAIRLGYTTNKLSYGTDESNNGVGVAPIINSNNDNIDYNELSKQWYKLEANSDEEVEIDSDYLKTEPEYQGDTGYYSPNGIIEIGDLDTDIINPAPENQVKEEDLTYNETFMPYASINNKDLNDSYLTVNEPPGGRVYTLSKYISLSKPKITLKKLANAENNGQVGIIVRSEGLIDDESREDFLFFKGNQNVSQNNKGIQNNSNVIVDLKNETVSYSKQWYNPAAQEQSITKTVSMITKMKREGVLPGLKKGVKCTCGKSDLGKTYKMVFEDTCPYCGVSYNTNSKKTVFKWVKCKTVKKVKTKKRIESAKKKGEKYETVEVIKSTGKHSYQLQCKHCGATFCGADGNNKNRKETRSLTQIGDYREQMKKWKSKTQQVDREEIVINHPVGGYVLSEITVVNDTDLSGETDDKKDVFSNVFTDNSIWPRFYGNVEIELFGCELISIESDDTILYEFRSFPFVKHKNTIPLLLDDYENLEFNFKKIGNKPKIINKKITSNTLEDIIIELWRCLEDNNGIDPLEIVEDVDVDIVDKDNTIYNSGDIIYLKLPNGKTYEIPVSETGKNNSKRGEADIKVGQIKNTPLIKEL